MWGANCQSPWKSLSKVETQDLMASKEDRTCLGGFAEWSLAEVTVVVFAEARNLIYAFASSHASGERCCVVPCLQLAQTCRQLRHEYRPICFRSYVTIDWKDVPAYFRTFFPTRGGRISNIDFAPTGMTVFTNTYYKRTPEKVDVQIDLLPILMVGLVDKSFECKFRYDPGSPEATNMDADIYAMMTADVNTIQKLLTHQHPNWLRDVTSGRVSSLLISHIGTNDYPRAQFVFQPTKEGRVSCGITRRNRVKTNSSSPHQAEIGQNQLFLNPHALSGYVGHVDLRKIFVENDYIFLWDVKLDDSPQQEAELGFFLE
ncbi:hypothetical protein ST47_g3892 [Ascochyta rabiei]|uniref:Uncharacterized protein n=1 Tax=Didymella rabiei TaxID=5454 RepID=A0A163GQ01_DIDRA|nr:hypothetical protein ST47_g3892 [Ascochyta rabiei]